MKSNTESNTESNLKTYQATKEQVLSVLKLSNKKAVTVALVGAVDSGKAAFVSLLLELFQGTEADDLIRDYSDERFNQPHSQTTDVTLHNITTLDGGVIQILDAPDFGTKDDRLSAEKKIRNSMQADIHSIDALLVVADGHSVQLASDTLDAITEIFPRTLVGNIGVVFANSDQRDWKFDMNSLPSELRNAERWVLYNPLATLQKYHGVKNERPDDKQAAEELEDEVKMYYSLGAETLGRWAKWVDSCSIQSTDKLCEPFEFKTKVDTNINAIGTKAADLKKSEMALEEIGVKLEDVRNEARKVFKELNPDIYETIPSFPPGTGGTIRSGSPDIDDFEREELVSRLDKMNAKIKQLEDYSDSTEKAIKETEGIIETIQNDIRRLIDDFYKLSFSQKFASNVNDTIQMLQDKKAETEIERNIIDKVIEVFKGRLHALDGQ
ncbi:hypothetical protein RSOLAG1IB_05376 [Rhizoctonia solani AG-1 IB]|uniref:AIG1-type G domain-containing protein n=1 Tax=Thanatephorus cucumeris (strain AG1-IB / isolate 7/3/14) TaxID=1108050 RepID=M5C017_THACB|nr:hypothetical protein BN14_06315 [Rhizoctonia solani AG-1 IB]CEL63332.1 hypothetical protein RSOLAG1IB_05376 [Rhizoctonia solani AG-1 IB]